MEYDDRVDGGAGSAARFTTAMTYSNGPEGAFISQSLTRMGDSSILSQSNKVDVVNVAQTIVQLNTEDAFIGVDLVLNDDGTATKDSLNTAQSKINQALDNALLTSRGEGPRASKCVWTPSSTDVLNVPEPLVNGVLDLNLNGTVHNINTVVRVRSGGQ